MIQKYLDSLVLPVIILSLFEANDYHEIINNSVKNEEMSECNIGLDLFFDTNQLFNNSEDALPDEEDGSTTFDDTEKEDSASEFGDFW